MPENGKAVAVARGGPMDGSILGPAHAERYEIRMKDKTVHLYLRSEAISAERVDFHHAGRL